MAFHEYPYTDFHEMNLDWILQTVKQLTEDWAQVRSDWEDEQAAFADLQSYIENYFNNLDVQQEINVKLDGLVLDGTMSELIAPYVASGLPAEVASQLGDVVAAQIGAVVAAQIGAVVADQLPAIAASAAATEVGTWLSTHIDPDTGYVIDDSLTVQGAAADAKAVGDEVTAIKSALSKLEDDIALTPITQHNCDGYVGQTITITENNTFRYAKISDVKYGYKYVATLRTLSNISVPYVFLCDANDVILSVYYGTTASANNNIEILVNDKNAKYLYIRSAAATISAKYIVSSDGALDIANTIYNLYGDAPKTKEYEKTCEGNVGETIVVSSDSSWDYCVASVEVSYKYTIKFKSLPSRSDVGYIYLCDVNDKIIKKITEDTLNAINTKTVIINDESIVKMYVRTYGSGNILEVKRIVSSDGVLNMINGIESDLSNVDAKLFRNDFVSDYEDDQALAQMESMVDCIGIDTFKDKKITSVAPYHYTAWPLLGKIGDTIYCIYTIQDKHVSEDHVYFEGYYYRTSKDGVVWSTCKPLYGDGAIWGGQTGCGNNSNGDLLIWCRKNDKPRFALYKLSASGIAKVTELPNNTPFEHIGDIFSDENGNLYCFYNTYGDTRAWGYYVSTDDGLTWTQNEVEYNLSVDDCPVEICGVYLGDGKILAMGRKDTANGTVAMFQIESDDYGANWTKSYTNITDVRQSTPALIYDSENDNLYLYYFQRVVGVLRKRINTVSSVWNHPNEWNDSEVIANGTNYATDNGNVKAIKVKDYQLATFYSGVPTLTGIYSVLSDYIS